MTKGAGLCLQNELTKRGKISHFFHSGLEASDKQNVLELIGRKLVIATTGKESLDR
jgi:hypothetical protein